MIFKKNNIKNLVRALRLPFLSVSILPFVFGSLIERSNFNFLGFLFGFLAVVATHLSSNLINDYVDSRSGADWQDKNFYKFFGGSKLIQEGVFIEKFYFNLALLFLSIAIISIFLLSFFTKRIITILFYILIIALSWSYSEKPLQFSYHRLGELIIFILFGPVLVMGGYFIQTGIFPDLKSFMLSLPFGFFTTTILFVNEIPDFPEDQKVGKFNWVSIFGVKNAFLIYYFLIFFGFLVILIDIILKYLNIIASFSFLLIIPAIKAGGILKKYSFNKSQLVKSSRLTIMIHFFISIILILAILL